MSETVYGVGLLSLLAIFMSAMASAIGYHCGHEDGKTLGMKLMQTEALQRGYATFTVENDQIIFKWNERIIHE